MSDWRILLPVERARREAHRRAGRLLPCGPGCDSCCRRPFAITEADAERLRQGLEKAPAAVREAILARALAYRIAVAHDFPGDSNTGVLARHPEWREWFFGRHEGRVCPVLDPDSGACLLHRYRPVACRLYGPLIRIGGDHSGPCPLCYEGLSSAEIEGFAVTVAEPAFRAPEGPETLIALSLLE